MDTMEYEILQLITSKQEGVYWDFKEVPYENNARLLHDVLCLANSLHSGNRYIIFGVSDPKKGCNIIGLKKNQLGRKEQAQYIDFFRKIEFAGDQRPELLLKTIQLKGKQIDVLVIFDRPFKPYFLKSEYSDKGIKLRPGLIYSRINDTNTPVERSCDIFWIEKMWRQRFGLDLTPVERMKSLLLKPMEWFKDIGNKKYLYHKQNPEYRIKLSEVKRFSEPYSYFFTNEKSFLGTAKFMYHTTILFECEFMYADEMREVLVPPLSKYIRIDNEDHWFYYFQLDNIEGLFLQFLREGNWTFDHRGGNPHFLFFNNSEEVDFFVKYLEGNIRLLHSIKPEPSATWAKRRIKRLGKEFRIDLEMHSRIYIVFREWQNRHQLIL